MQTKRARRATKHEHTHRHDIKIEMPVETQLQKVLTQLRQRLSYIDGLMQASPDNNAFRIGIYLNQANLLLAEAQVMAARPRK